MKKLIKYLKDYKLESVMGPLFKLLEASFELLVPLVMAAIIDNGINAGAGRAYIIKMCAVLAALGLIGLICSVTAQFFAAKAATGFAAKVRHALFLHIESLSFSEIDELGTSGLITRMTSDINQIQNGVNLALRLFLRSPFVVFGAMIMAFTIDIKAALIFVGVIPVLSIVIFGIMLITMPIYKNAQKSLDRVLGITRENLSGARVIRAFCRESVEREEFEKKNEELSAIQKYAGKISALMNPLTYAIINMAVIALIWAGAVRVDNGSISQGALVALYNYMSQILVELIKLANMIITITRSMASAKRVSEVMDVQCGLINGSKTPDARGSVEFDNVSLAYRKSGGDAVSNISFRAKPGETIGIIGGTGSGKTTIVNMIPRFYDATAGKVMIGGVDVRELDVRELRDRIGIVMQNSALFKGTIRSNMRWGKKDATDKEIYEALETAQARDFVDEKQGGLDFEIEQGGKNLSGGQRQRLTIARALVKKPDILILDDSASALDFATDAALRSALRRMTFSPTVFIVSQRAASIMHADTIIALDDGEIAGIGSHDKLLRECAIYNEIYYSQFPKEAA